MKKVQAKIAIILSVLLVVCLFLPIASAAEKIDVTRGVSLSLEYKHNGTPIENAAFSVYKVANMAPNGMFAPTADFVRYSVDYDDLSAEKMKNLSDTLLGYIKRDKITPISKNTTNSNGFCAFYFKKTQTAGLYMIVGEKKQVGDKIYTPEVLLISLPAKAQDGSYLYVVKAVPKAEITEKNDKTDIEVTKVWKNDKGENRPESVTVQLMKNNAVYAEVTLNKANNWRHEWKDLDAQYTWTVAEKTIPYGYEVSVNHSGKNYIISNTFDESRTTEPTKPDDTTNPSGTTDPNGTTNPNDKTTNPGGTTNPNDNTTNPGGTTNPNDKTTNPDGTTNPNDNTTNPGGTTSPNDKTTNPNGSTNPNDTTYPGGTTNPNGGTTRPVGSSTTDNTTAPNGSGSTTSPDSTKPNTDIPQTGMLEWPIPLMFEFGVTFIAIGIIFCVRKKNEYEK